MSRKQVLRKTISTVLDRLERSYIASQSDVAAQVLRTLPLYQQAQKIAFYMHMETGELQTGQMIANAFLDGKRVFLPHIVRFGPNEVDLHPWFPGQKTHLEMLEMPNWEAVQMLQPRGKYNLREPIEGYDALSFKEETGLDLIVMPGVGFSSDKGRIGHGAGYYDSFINEHEATKHYVPKLIGVGLPEQLVDPNDLPMEPHDRPLDAVILGENAYL